MLLSWEILCYKWYDLPLHSFDHQPTALNGAYINFSFFIFNNSKNYACWILENSTFGGWCWCLLKNKNWNFSHGLLSQIKFLPNILMPVSVLNFFTLPFIINTVQFDILHARMRLHFSINLNIEPVLLLHFLCNTLLFIYVHQSALSWALYSAQRSLLLEILLSDPESFLAAHNVSALKVWSKLLKNYLKFVLDFRTPTKLLIFFVFSTVAC